jgi:hypothetical protein
MGSRMSVVHPERGPAQHARPRFARMGFLGASEPFARMARTRFPHAYRRDGRRSLGLRGIRRSSRRSCGLNLPGRFSESETDRVEGRTVRNLEAHLGDVPLPREPQGQLCGQRVARRVSWRSGRALCQGDRRSRVPRDAGRSEFAFGRGWAFQLFLATHLTRPRPSAPARAPSCPATSCSASRKTTRTSASSSAPKAANVGSSRLASIGMSR